MVLVVVADGAGLPMFWISIVALYLIRCGLPPSNNSNAQGVLTGTLDALKKLI
jgi:hypothetical protein